MDLAYSYSLLNNARLVGMMEDNTRLVGMMEDNARRGAIDPNAAHP
jgi:hypothetical protein